MILQLHPPTANCDMYLILEATSLKESLTSFFSTAQRKSSFNNEVILKLSCFMALKRSLGPRSKWKIHRTFIFEFDWVESEWLKSVLDKQDMYLELRNFSVI